MANPYNFFIDPFEGFNKVVETFTTPGFGTWTCPDGVTSAYVECWGPGGGSYNSYIVSEGGSPLSGDSGGGGAYAAKTISVVPGTDYSYNVGAGGPANSTSGENSYLSLSPTVLVSADGANGKTGGTAAASIGDVKYSGGNGLDGRTNATAGPGGGGCAGDAGNGTNGTESSTGQGNGTDSGDGGAYRTTAGNGNSGSSFGGGASGAYSKVYVGHSYYGVDGAPGAVRITYYI